LETFLKYTPRASEVKPDEALAAWAERSPIVESYPSMLQEKRVR